MSYKQLFQHYELWAKLNLVQKHFTFDSTFYIIKEDLGFKTVKFYNDSTDVRMSGHLETLSEAYNEAFHTL